MRRRVEELAKSLEKWKDKSAPFPPPQARSTSTPGKLIGLEECREKTASPIEICGRSRLGPRRLHLTNTLILNSVSIYVGRLSMDR